MNPRHLQAKRHGLTEEVSRRVAESSVCGMTAGQGGLNAAGIFRQNAELQPECCNNDF